MRGRAGVFLDRDGTIIEDAGYLGDPAGVRLLPGSAEAVARLNRAGRPVIVVTNQSGIARGLLGEQQYLATEARLDALLSSAGAAVDAHYHCPHHPDITGPCDCRKPGTLLYRRAAERFGLDPHACWWVGDRLRDVEAALTLGGRGILVRTGEGMIEAQRDGASRYAIVDDLAAAVGLILRDAGER
ncbi:MAG TPA: HAD-IIIA family hydrolase [Gemmatimonadales bacterium]|nr:HAD-IIIA family hydrolase [Gemmatimonadales bacterium]